MRVTWNIIALAATIPELAQAIDLDVSNSDSIKSAASTVASGMVSYYDPANVGVLPQPYYWWEAGAMWGALLDYWYFTGDDKYNDITTQALLSQAGPDHDFMVPAEMNNEGNDDQAFWGFATMSAAEKGYPEPSGGYSWLRLTENLWNTQVRRWDTSTCGGGLRWQIFSSNNGYDYKNSVSNGAFFQLSARLARFTGNQTYGDWAEKSLQWSQNVGLISSDWRVYDGTQDTTGCSVPDKVQWTYNAGIYLYGSAIMYDYTNGSPDWESRTRGFLSTVNHFFSPSSNSSGIMFEPACETIDTCNNDEYSFKGYLSRFMWATTLVAPFTESTISPLLKTSSSAAANSCSGGDDGVTCGQHWYYGGYDGKFGVGQQMSALETIQGLLIGGTSKPLQGGEDTQSPAPTTSAESEPTSTTAEPTSTTAEPTSTTSEPSSTTEESTPIPTTTQLPSVQPTTTPSSSSLTSSRSEFSSPTSSEIPVVTSSTSSRPLPSSTRPSSSSSLIPSSSTSSSSSLVRTLTSSVLPSSVTPLPTSSASTLSTTISGIPVASQTTSETPSPTATKKPNGAGKSVERASWLMGLAIGLTVMIIS